MAIRNIVKLGDEILTKKCREVKDINARIISLLDDMRETLKNANGVGLAAPQVGVLRRVAIVDTGEKVLDLINPEIISSEGEQIDAEGCLSYPGKYGLVKRPRIVTIRATDRNGDTYEYTGEDLTARAFCHEIDHLDGHFFTEKVTEWVDVEDEEE